MAEQEIKAYPEVVNVGDTVFPMLYIFYFGDSKNNQIIGNENKFKNAFKEYINNLLSIYETNGNIQQYTEDNLTSKFNTNIQRYYKSMTSAAKSNKMWMWALNNAVVAIMEKYKVRMPQIKGVYYEGKDRKGTSYSPILNPDDPNNLWNMMEALRILFENDIISWDFNLGTRAISLDTGEYVSITQENYNQQRMSRINGAPKIGQFTLNNRKSKPIMGRTFTGTDMKIVVTLNHNVSMIKDMTSFSWSVHRGKPTGRPVGRTGPRGRGGGSRTIAGTMIFAASDHEPLLDILPEETTTRRQETLGWNNKPYRTVVMPDQLPPFDVMVIMSNEYGSYAITTVYGVEIVDYGSQYSVDNLVNEHVYQYTASGMDPLVEAYPDENGFFDPYGLLQGGYSEMWFKKEAAMEGLLYSNLEDMWTNHLKSINTNTKRFDNDKKYQNR